MLLGKLETIYRRAVDDHHFAAAARAVELQAKLAGIDLTRQTARARTARERQSPGAGRHPERASHTAPSDHGLQHRTGAGEVAVREDDTLLER
jgi:hypothetical protein